MRFGEIINYLCKLVGQLLRTEDVLFRESKSKKGLLYYIYIDGTVENKIIIE